MGRGTNIPAPSIVVVKYDTLASGQRMEHIFVSQVLRGRSGASYVPIDVAAVLASRSKLGIELNTSKDTLLAADRADEAHETVHAAGDVDGVAHGDIVADELARRVGSHVSGAGRLRARARTVADYRIEGVGAGDIGNAGERGRGQGGEGSLAR